MPVLKPCLTISCENPLLLLKKRLIHFSSLVSGYFDDYRVERAGKDPPREWRASAGAAVKRALANGETPDHIAACLGVVAHEGKNPSCLPNVLADSHAGRERRMK